MMNPENWPVETGLIEKVGEGADGGMSITFDGGWTLQIFSDEVDIFVEATGRKPQPGDPMICYGGLGRPITGIVIDDTVLRYKTRAQVEQERQEWLANYERQKEEAYHKNIARWQSEVEALHPTLKKRIRRFEAEKGAYEFWKDSGGYEMYAVNGANALINWASSQAIRPQDQIQALDNWWAMNSAEGGYDYKGQMELVPEFGDGHSGWTASAAYGMAKAILDGSYKE